MSQTRYPMRHITPCVNVPYKLFLCLKSS